MKYNKPNSAATGREACISFDPPSFGKAFYAVDNRDNSMDPTTTHGPALFVGANQGFRAISLARVLKKITEISPESLEILKRS